MAYIICHSLYIFCAVLEAVLFLYIMSSWFPNATRFRGILLTLLDPIFVPVRGCLKRSVLNHATIDLTSMVTLILLSYLQSLFYGLSL